MKGLIFDVRRFSTNDGPGIRTTVFFKGCPLHCIWCHNPESRFFDIEFFARQYKLDDCIIEKNEQIGRWMEMNELINEISKDKVFYDESQGGVTFSGGEALLQHVFLKEALMKCRDLGIHTAVDTSGYTSPSVFEEISNHADLFLYDLKLMNDDEHIKYTGKSNVSILENLHSLKQLGTPVIIRFPVIPGITDSPGNIAALKLFLKNLMPQINRISLLPYHKLAQNKYCRLAINNDLADLKEVSKESLINLENELNELGFTVSIGY